MAETGEATFERIALTISGGGFRAAAYGLGTLNLLHLLGVLENVQMLSTISGGTITGAFYAARRKRGQSMDMIYDDFYKILGRDEILENSVRNWGKAADTPGANYKLIRAFADTYHEQLYGRERFDLFWQPDVPAAPFHLQSVIFSATELNTGTAFRFQYASQLPDQVTEKGRTFDSYYIGNGNITIPRGRARTIRIADIVASSSCFPVGFEPLVLPDDFFSKNDPALVFQTSNGTIVDIERLGVIDGGVYDNQGIEAIVTANNRNADYLASIDNAVHNPLLDPSTLLLIADVASAEKEIYTPPGPGPQAGKKQPLGRIGKTINLITLLSLAIAVLLGVLQLRATSGGNFFFGLLAGVALTISAILFALGKVWGNVADRFDALQPDIYRMGMPVFLKFTFAQWGYLLNVRIMTGVKLLLSVFLRRVRSLNYGLVYDDGNTFRPKVIAGILTGILRDADRASDPNRNSLRAQSRVFIPIIETASKMGTTLWWLKDRFRMDPIIASAEITLTYRILVYFEKIGRQQPCSPLPAKDQQVLERARLIWRAFLLSQDASLPDTYLPGFRLHPSMAAAIASPGTTSPEQLIALAREHEAHTKSSAADGPINSSPAANP